MTFDDHARSYLEKATKRRRVLEVLLEEEACSDVVREAQELVELALKGMLRAIGVDPPKWHDVGPVLLEQTEAFDPDVREALPQLAAISGWPKEREFTFYGDIDFIPTDQYTRKDAERAMTDAVFNRQYAAQVISEGDGKG